MLSSGWLGWTRLVATSDRLVVFVSRLAGESGPAREIAADQLDALVERLQEQPSLAAALELRVLPVPMNEEQARVVIDTTPGVAVIFGTVRTAADEARWKAEVLLEWPGQTTQAEQGHVWLDHARKEAHFQAYGRRERAPARHETHLDAEQPLTALTAERFESRHADSIEGTLLALVADALALDHRDDEAHTALAAAEPFRDTVSLKTRAAMEVRKAMLAGAQVGVVTLDRMEHAGLQDTDHPDLWDAALLLVYFAQERLDDYPERRLRIAEHAFALQPSSPTARYNLATSCEVAGDSERALAELQQVAQDPWYSEREYVHLTIGNLAYNAGDSIVAARAYRTALDISPSGVAHLYLADALRNLGEVRAARAHYLSALRMDRTLVAAYHGYWSGVPEGEEVRGRKYIYDVLSRLLIAASDGSAWRRRLSRPLLWRLMVRHHRRHPEDARLYYSLGATALTRMDLDLADDMLTFAIALLPEDLQAHARRAVVLALQNRREEAIQTLKLVRDVPPLPGRPGDPGYPWVLEDSPQVRGFEFIRPFLDEPHLAYLPHAQDFMQTVGDMFEMVDEQAEYAKWALEQAASDRVRKASSSKPSRSD